MRIHIATDHAGLEFSTQLFHHLAAQGHDVVDYGPLDYDPLDDYPAFCIRAAKGVVRDQEDGVEGIDDPPDHNRRDLDRIAVGDVACEMRGLEVAHPVRFEPAPASGEVRAFDARAQA